LPFGVATKVTTRVSLAASGHDVKARLTAKTALAGEPIRFSSRQALAIGRGFAMACREGAYRCHACAILPEHVHLVIGRHERPIGRIVGHLKTRGRQRLAAERLGPEGSRPAWGHGSWRVFLYTPEEVARSIAYVEANPGREAKPRQRWSFVVPFEAPGE
jgi:REP element-mobilizing transposase RayT